MATSAQINANRANALLSTGPRSVEGKAASSRNSFRLGLTAQSLVIPGEDPAELEELTTALESKLRPVGPIEEALLQTVVRAQWMMRRYTRIESEYLASRIAALPEGTDYPLGVVIAQDAANGNVLQKIFRRQQAAQREWYRAMETLSAVQTNRRKAETEPDRPLAAHIPDPNRLRFRTSPAPAGPRAPEPPENLALRL